MFKIAALLTALSLFSWQCAYAGKVVVFDHQQAIVNTQAAQEAIKKVKETPKFKQLLQQGESLQSEFLALKKEYESEGVTWSEKQKTDKTRVAGETQKKLQRVAQQAQNMQAAAVGEIAKTLQPKLEKILEKIMMSEQVDMILQKQSVYTALPAVDITQSVTDALNKVSK